MSTLRCCNCGRRLRRAAGVTDGGPVGPVCALRLGLPRAVPKQRAVRIVRFMASRWVDAKQQALEFPA